MPAAKWTEEHRAKVAAAKAATAAVLPYRCSGCGQRRATWAAMRDHHERCTLHRQHVQNMKRPDAAATARGTNHRGVISNG